VLVREIKVRFGATRLIGSQHRAAPVTGIRDGDSPGLRGSSDTQQSDANPVNHCKYGFHLSLGFGFSVRAVAEIDAAPSRIMESALPVNAQDGAKSRHLF
jgi:hypothetical protein